MCFKKFTFELFTQLKYVQIPGVNSDAGRGLCYYQALEYRDFTSIITGSFNLITQTNKQTNKKSKTRIKDSEEFE